MRIIFADTCLLSPRKCQYPLSFTIGELPLFIYSKKEAYLLRSIRLLLGSYSVAIDSKSLEVKRKACWFLQEIGKILLKQRFFVLKQAEELKFLKL